MTWNDIPFYSKTSKHGAASIILNAQGPMRRRSSRRSRVSDKSTILASAFYSQVDLIMGYNGHVNQQGSQR